MRRDDWTSTPDCAACECAKRPVLEDHHNIITACVKRDEWSSREHVQPTVVEIQTPIPGNTATQKEPDSKTPAQDAVVSSVFKRSAEETGLPTDEGGGSDVDESMPGAILESLSDEQLERVVNGLSFDEISCLVVNIGQTVEARDEPKQNTAAIPWTEEEE